MRELTNKELDAVCGGLFDFSLGCEEPHHQANHN